MRRFARLALPALFVLACFAATAGLAFYLRASAPVAAVAPSEPLPVETIKAVRAVSYTIDDRFAGRLEAARAVDLAFERPGLVVEVLAEEGDRVAAGDVLARLDTAALEAERAGLVAARDKAEADLDLARLTAERQATLRERGHAAAAQDDAARFGLNALEAEAARVLASIKRLDVDVAKSTLQAPFAGTVTARALDEGAIAAAGTPVLGLVEDARPRARIGLSAAAAAMLEPGDSVAAEAGGWAYTATLIALRPDMTERTRTVPALFAIGGEAPPPFGEVVRVALPRTVAEAGFWLPRAALSEGRRGLWTVLTIVAEAGGHSVGREAVEVLHAEADRVFVRGTLEHGARVVAGGTHRVIPGQAVRPTGSEG